MKLVSLPILDGNDIQDQFVNPGHVVRVWAQNEGQRTATYISMSDGQTLDVKLEFQRAVMAINGGFHP